MLTKQDVSGLLVSSAIAVACIYNGICTFACFCKFDVRFSSSQQSSSSSSPSSSPSSSTSSSTSSSCPTCTCPSASNLSPTLAADAASMCNGTTSGSGNNNDRSVIDMLAALLEVDDVYAAGTGSSSKASSKSTSFYCKNNTYQDKCVRASCSRVTPNSPYAKCTVEIEKIGGEINCATKSSSRARIQNSSDVSSIPGTSLLP